MHPRTPAPRTLALPALAGSAGLALVLAMPLAAQAHVELDASTTAPASLSVLTFAVGHGCEGSATTSLAIALPSSVQAVTPTVAAGWSVGEEETGDGTTVTYTAATPLPDGLRDTFQIQALLPVDEEAGDVVAFPTLQTCVEGSTAWDEPAAVDGTEPDHPAPTITLATAGGEAEAADALPATAVAAVAPVDGTARLLGLGALIVGVVAVLLLTIGMRRPQQGDRR